MKNLSYDVTLCFCYLSKEFHIDLKSFVGKNFGHFYSICAKNSILNASNTYFNNFNFDSCQQNFESQLLSLQINQNQSNEFLLPNYSTMNSNVKESFFENISLNEKIFMSFLAILYTITVLISIIGNMSVIVVMSCGYRSSYLDISIFLVNLGIFNLLMSIFCIPFTFINTLLKKWIFPPFMCSLTSFFQLLSVNGVILTLVYLAINRYNAVVYPLKYNSEKTKNQKRKSILAIWLISISLSIIQLFIYKCDSSEYTQTDLNSNESKQSYCYCQEIWDPKNVGNDAKYYLAYTLWIFIETYALPGIIIIIIYSKIISILWKRNCNNRDYFTAKQTSSSDVYNEKLKSRTIKVIRMLCAVMLTFLMNWLPIHTFHIYMAYIFYKNKLHIIEENQQLLSIIFYFCHWLSMSNSFINPVIYSLMNDQFKV